MILFCKEKGITTLCITDTNMYGVMEFYKECKNNGIKPIIGLELNINDKIHHFKNRAYQTAKKAKPNCMYL